MIALALLDSEMASVWKYVILTLSTFVLSNALVHAYRVLLKPRLVGSAA